MLAERIEELRRELERKLEYHNLSEGNIVEMSRILDVLICEYTAISIRETKKQC